MPITEGGRFAPTQNIVSPGVFTREIDQSGLAQGVANIGGAIVAPFADGPAFFPKTMTDVATLESTFGVADGIYYGPYTSKQYLQEQGIVTVVRIGGLTGYWQKNPLIVYAQPGTWGRNNDMGAITDDSFVSLDTTNYTATFNYQQSSSVWNITGSPTLGGATQTVGGFITASLKFTKLTASFASSSIDQFYAGIYNLPNATTIKNLLYTSASKGKLFTVTTRQLKNRFNTSVLVSGKKTTPSGGSYGYSLAAFDCEKSRISGSVRVAQTGSLTSPSNTKYVLTFDSCWNGTGAGINQAPNASPSYLNYLTNSYVMNGSDVEFGLVFAKYTNQSVSFVTASLSSNSTGVPDHGANKLSSSVKIASRYDISRLQLVGESTVTFGDIASTSNLVSSQLNGGTGTDLSGSVLYSGQTA